MGRTQRFSLLAAMVVLERPLSHAHHELDLVTTPAGDPVAMVHCNNGASELGAWVGMFRAFAAAAGTPVDTDAAFEALFRGGIKPRGGFVKDDKSRVAQEHPRERQQLRLACR